MAADADLSEQQQHRVCVLRWWPNESQFEGTRILDIAPTDEITLLKIVRKEVIEKSCFDVRSRPSKRGR